MEEEIKFSDVEVEADPQGYGATEINAYSAKISHEQLDKSALELVREDLGYDGKEEKDEEYQELLDEKVGDFLRKWLKGGHTSIYYQSNKGLNYKVPRQTTMFMCQFDYSKYLQQSLRYTEADDFISAFEGDERVEELYERSKELYNKMISDDEEDIKKEDARFVLPLGTAAKHIHQNLNFISLANIYREINKESSRIPDITKEAIDKGLEALEEQEPIMFNRKNIEIYNDHNDKGYTVTNMFSETNQALKDIKNNGNGAVTTFCVDIEDLENSEYKESFLNLGNYGVMKPSVKGFLTSMSLATWHQFMRNDAVKQSVESVYDAAERGDIVVPPEIQISKYLEDFEELCERSLDVYEELREEAGDNAIEVVPHALSLDVAFTVDYYNFDRGFIQDRKHKGAQWEIREIAQEVDETIRVF